MLGALIHNINLPENKFEFLFMPMYAFGSQKAVGLGRLSYSWYPDNHHLNRISIGINGAHFDTNKATDSTGRLLFENFSKLVPYIRIDFKPSGPRSTISEWMDFKSYLIKEINFEQFNVSSKDSLIHPNSTSSSFRYINQLSFNLQDSLKLGGYIKHNWLWLFCPLLTTLIFSCNCTSIQLPLYFVSAAMVYRHRLRRRHCHQPFATHSMYI